MFLGAVSSVVVSVLFFSFAVIARDKRLAQMTAAATVVGCIATFFLSRML